MNTKANKEQFDRYRRSLNNLIITDYLSFQLYEESGLTLSVAIAAEKDGGIESEPLTRIMADKTKPLTAIIKNAKENSIWRKVDGVIQILKDNQPLKIKAIPLQKEAGKLKARVA